MSEASYEEVMSELEDLDEEDQENFVEALNSRLERRIEINEEQQKLSQKDALEREEPFNPEEQFTYFQDTAREALQEYDDQDLEDLDEVSREYIRRLARTNRILEDSGQEAGLMGWLSNLDNLVYSMAESKRRTKSQFGDLDMQEEKYFSMVDKFTYESIRNDLEALEYHQFLEYVDEIRELEERVKELGFDENLGIDEEMNISGEDFEKMEEEAQRRRKDIKEELELYLAAVPEEVVARAPHRYREAIHSFRSEEDGSEYEIPSMTDIVETDFAAALRESKSRK